MTAMARQQEQMRDAVQQTVGALLPAPLEEMRRQNVAMMERAMSLFTPFYRPSEGVAPKEHATPAAEIDALKAELEALRAQLAEKK